jgi:hypothetical protein
MTSMSAKKLELPEEDDEISDHIDLLGTIKVPKNLTSLASSLPKSNYPKSTISSYRNGGLSSLGGMPI